MALTYKRSRTGTTIRATGADAMNLLQAMAGIAAGDPQPVAEVPPASKCPAEAHKPVPNRSKREAGATGAATGDGAA